MKSIYPLLAAAILLFSGCSQSDQQTPLAILSPVASTTRVPGDADDCCIWVDKSDPERSVIIGNDKEDAGGLYTWDLEGKLLHRIVPLSRPVNVDIAHDVQIAGKTMDIVACPLRGSNELRIYRMDPESRELQDITAASGIPTGFDQRTYGFALYHRPKDGKLFAFVSQKATSDIHQFELRDNGNGKITGVLVRQFGAGDQESYVEGMCVDDELGWLYCADEQAAVLKYKADPEGGDKLVHRFALDDGITEDREGLALITEPNGKGYLLLSNQGEGNLKVYRREGNNDFVGTIKKTGSNKTDGVAANSHPLGPKYPRGIVACHNDAGANFVLYSWEDADLTVESE